MALFLGSHYGEVAEWSRTAELLDRFQAELKAELCGLGPEERLTALRRCRDAIQEKLQEEQRFRLAFHSAAEQIAAAEGGEKLGRAVREAHGHAAAYFRRHDSVAAIHTVCTAIADLAVHAALDHAVQLLAATDRIAPAPWSWLAHGDHGRRECSLNRDLAGILCWDRITAGSASYFTTLGGMASSLLLEGGFVSRDTVLPSVPACRGSLDDWRSRLAAGRRFTADPASLADLRHLHGSPGPAVALIRMIRETQLARETGIRTRSRRSLRDLARIVAHHPAGVDLFGRLRLEKTGPYRKRFNLGLYGIEPLISSVRLLAICRESVGTGTVERIRSLQDTGKLSVDLAERLLDAWHTFLRLQLRNEAAGVPADGCRFVDVNALPPEEQQHLKAALDTVEQLQLIVYQTLEPA